MRLCYIEECSRKCKIRGYCGKHYECARRDGIIKVKTKKINKLIQCKCGCKEFINKYDNNGRIRIYINGHFSRKGLINTLESKKKVSITKIGFERSEKCQIFSCSNEYHGKGLCKKHLTRLRNTGTTDIIVKKRFCSIECCDRIHYAKNYCHKHYQVLSNPHSTSKNYELTIRMNNVRVRDKNTCKWYNCGLTHKELTIHVHHIFPKSEYPQFEYEEKYMICYCRYHHRIWHKSRKDYYWKII